MESSAIEGLKHRPLSVLNVTVLDIGSSARRQPWLRYGSCTVGSSVEFEPRSPAKHVGQAHTNPGHSCASGLRAEVGRNREHPQPSEALTMWTALTALSGLSAAAGSSSSTSSFTW